MMTQSRKWHTPVDRFGSVHSHISNWQKTISSPWSLAIIPTSSRSHQMEVEALRDVSSHSLVLKLRLCSSFNTNTRFCAIRRVIEHCRTRMVEFRHALTTNNRVLDLGETDHWGWHSDSCVQSYVRN